MSNYRIHDFIESVKTEFTEELTETIKEFLNDKGEEEAREIIEGTTLKLDLNELAEGLKESFLSNYLDRDELNPAEALYKIAENEVIYYYDCWQIAQRLNLNYFEITSTGETASNICELAFYGLVDYFYQEVNHEEFNNEAIEEAISTLGKDFFEIAKQVLTK